MAENGGEQATLAPPQKEKKTEGEVPTEEAPQPPSKVIYSLDPQLREILQKSLSLVQKKGAKKKTEVDERDVPILLRSLGLNPSERQVEYIILRAREDEATSTSKGHIEYENFEQKVAEALALDPGYARHSASYIIAALRKISPKGQDYIEPDHLKSIMTQRGLLFSDDEVDRMLRVAKDKGTGKVWHDDYAEILATDGINNDLQVNKPSAP